MRRTHVVDLLPDVVVDLSSLEHLRIDGDALSVALYVDRDPVSDAGRLALGGYQDLRGEWGQAVINTAAFDIGTWYLFAEVLAGGRTSASRAHGSTRCEQSVMTRTEPSKILRD